MRSSRTKEAPVRGAKANWPSSGYGRAFSRTLTVSGNSRLRRESAASGWTAGMT
jgi:hypothetical protein